tara:strand:+ start:2914 stop:3870 length:957 start_codon:yes stop_codon:yes gene_type:complete
MKKIVIVFLLLVLVLASPVIIKIYGLQPIVQSDIPSQGNWAQLTQGNLYYRWDRPLKENDNGETLVLVHGFSTPHFVWDGIKQILLDSGYSVLVYDHFGRGYSERPAATYNAELYIESLNELLGHQKLIEPVHLIGYSMGGAVVSHFAEAYPQKVKSLSLIAPAGFSSDESVINSMITLPLIGEWLGYMFVEQMLISDINPGEFLNINDPLAISDEDFVLKINKQLRYSGYVEALLSTLRNFNLFNALKSYEAVGTLNIPTLAIWGTADVVVPYKGVENLITAIPHTKIVTIDEGGHNITYMQPSIVGSAITDFLISQ